MTRLDAYRLALSAAVRDGVVVKALTKAIFSEADDVNDIMVAPLIFKGKVSDTRTNCTRGATR